MTESTTMTAYPRDIIGRANRRLASAGRIPAVLYGPGHPKSLPIAIDRHDFELFLTHHSAGSALVALAVEGEKRPVNAVVREVQYSPIKGNVIHVDFLAVRMDKAIHATVPLRLINDPAGVRTGGVLVVDLHEVSVEALPKALTEAIEIDIGALQVGDSLLLGEAVMPEGVTLLTDPETIVCSVQAPRAEVEVAPVPEEEAVEPELVGKEAETAEE